MKIGCCGFPVSKARYFEAFNVVELQRTFYQPPETSLAERWRRESPDEFEYTLKAWQLITHEPESPTYRKLKTKISLSKERNYGSFRPTDEVFSAWERTREVSEVLKARIIIFQCPQSFNPTTENKQNLEKFFSRVQRTKKFIFGWEPRGEWKAEEIRAICRDLDLVHVVDPFHSAPVYGKVLYYRLHGIGGYKYKYSPDDLKELRRRICHGQSSSDRLSGIDAYVMFDNVFMYEDAVAFKRLLEREEGNK